MDRTDFAAEQRTKQQVPFDTDSSTAVDDFQLSEESIEASQKHIGQWNDLVSTTNWEKGDIICKWRQERMDAGADAREYSDEAWSRLVNDVTSQHVGRLRRTHQRYGDKYKKYKGLYWSHFYATIDWEDAEMWLEGAVQNKWSVSKMRHQRWETLGKVESDRPKESDIVTAEVDEGLYVAQDSDDISASKENFSTEPLREGPDFGDDDNEVSHVSENTAKVDTDEKDGQANEKIDPVRPFANLPDDLPEDVVEAMEAYKLAIVRLKMAQWEECSSDDVLYTLDALKALVTAP